MTLKSTLVASSRLSLPELADFFLETMEMDEYRDRPTLPIDEKQPSVGDMWIAAGGPSDMPLLVIVTWIEGDEARGVLCLDEPNLATLEDMLVSEKDSPLGVPIALCLWRDMPLARASLKKYFGSLPEATLEPLLMLLQAKLAGNFIQEYLGPAVVRAGEEPSAKYSIEPANRRGPKWEYSTGCWVLNKDDPRLRVQKALKGYSAYLEAAALADI
jgi:hypothetical protein